MTYISYKRHVSIDTIKYFSQNNLVKKSSPTPKIIENISSDQNFKTLFKFFFKNWVLPQWCNVERMGLWILTDKKNTEVSQRHSRILGNVYSWTPIFADQCQLWFWSFKRHPADHLLKETSSINKSLLEAFPVPNTMLGRKVKQTSTDGARHFNTSSLLTVINTLWH